jgi:glucan 1,3-beta-glucosidase
MGLIQHETAYFQGNPNALSPFTIQAAYTDPTFEECTTANCARTWGLRIINSTNVFTYGAGLYHFFENWDSSCLNSETCQERMVDSKQASHPKLSPKGH